MSLNGKYDFMVIGAGSAGVRFARMASQNGAKVAIAEGHRAGGTCVIRGCVPKKLYVYASRFKKEFHYSEFYGWSLPKEGASFNMQKLWENKEKEIARLEGIYNNLLNNANVDIYSEYGSLKDENTVILSETQREIKADKIIIAVGGTPRPFEKDGIEYGLTSDDIFDIQTLPKTMFIYGGGYIAVEFASIFADLGVKVLLGCRGSAIAKGFDISLREQLSDNLKAQGIKIITSLMPENIFPETDKVIIKQDDKTYECDLFVNATGRIANTKYLGLENLGIKQDKSGAILVDDYSQTNIPSIYAIGDVTNRMSLTPVAIREAMALLQTLCFNNPTKNDYENIPTAIFTTPEIGTVGLTEQEILEQKIPCEVYESSFRSMKITMTDDNIKTYFKLLVHAETKQVLGCHIIDNYAGELIQLMGIVVKNKLTKEALDNVVAVHPTASEEFVTMRTPSRKLNI